MEKDFKALLSVICNNDNFVHENDCTLLEMLSVEGKETIKGDNTTFEVTVLGTDIVDISLEDSSYTKNIFIEYQGKKYVLEVFNDEFDANNVSDWYEITDFVPLSYTKVK